MTAPNLIRFRYRRLHYYCGTKAAIPLVLLLLFVGALCASAQPAPILFTGHLNWDCYQDTVYGKRVGQRAWLPDKIIWGKTDIHHAQPCDSDTTYGGHPPGAPRFSVTDFVYPTWQEGGSVSFEQYNTNDSLTDMLLFLWGTASTSSTVQDTGRALVLYGQLALDTVKTIYVGNIDSAMQTTPFFASDLDIDEELVNPAVRDMGNIRSYELLRQNFPVHSSGPPHLPITPGETLAEQASVTVYPNPAELWAHLQSEPLDAGEYTITVMAVNGREYHRQSVHLLATQQVERELDLSGLPSGYYMVRLHRDGRMISSYPIVIVR